MASLLPGYTGTRGGHQHSVLRERGLGEWAGTSSWHSSAQGWGGSVLDPGPPSELQDGLVEGMCGPETAGS